MKKQNNPQKTRLRIALSCTIMLGVMILFMSFSSAWVNTTFNDSLSAGLLNFTGSQNITRWLAVPEDIPFLTNAYLNISGLNSNTWNLSYCSYDGIELATTDTLVTDMYFRHDDGTKMYELGTAAANTIYQYTCTTGWDLSTCSYDTVSIAAQDGDSRGIFFSVNGTKFYEIGLTSDKIYEYNCTTAWDLSTCSYTNSFLGVEGNQPTGMSWKWNGTRVYEVGVPKLYQYDCSIPWILDSCVNSTETLAVRGAATAMFWEANGTSLFELDMTGKRIFQYDCNSDPWNLGACGNITGTYTLQGTISRGISFRNNGGKLYEADDNNNKFYQHNCGNYTEEPWLEVGVPDGVREWSYAGSFNITEITSNLISAVNSYLSGCVIADNVCLVPFLFHSDFAGFLRYFAMLFSNEGMGEVSQTYNATTYGTSTEGFIINITYDNSTYTGSSAILYYNKTSYGGAKTGGGNNFIFLASLITPDVTVSTSIEFYWTVALTNSSGVYYFNSTFNNQTVYRLEIDDCSTYTNEIFNFTLRDEETRDEMDGAVQNSSIVIDLSISNPNDLDSYVQYSNNFSELSNVSICMQNLTFGSRVDATISYMADEYVTEFYYLENYILENISSKLPNNIGLYDLLSDDSTSYLLTYQDCDYLFGRDKIIQVWRKYVEDGNFFLVEMTRTDDDGQGVSHLVSEDIEYKYIVLDNGVIEWETEVFRALCTGTPCQISINQVCPVDDFIDYTQEYDFSYTLTLTRATRTIELAYVIPSGASATVALNVTELDYLMNNTICAETQVGAGGTLSCVIGGALRNTTYYTEVFKDGEFITDAYLSLDTNAVEEFGVWGVVLSGFLILTFALMFVATGWGVVVAVILGFIVAMVLTIVAFSWTIMIWLAIAGAIIVYKISKKVGTG